MNLDEHDLAEDDRAGEIRGFVGTFAAWMLVVETPVGEPCHVCKIPITILDAGHTQIYVSETTTRVAVHRDCFLESIGGLAHDPREP